MSPWGEVGALAPCVIIILIVIDIYLSHFKGKYVNDDFRFLYKDGLYYTLYKDKVIAQSIFLWKAKHKARKMIKALGAKV